MNMKAASSFISFEQAELNVQRELGNDAFDNTIKKAKQVWNRELGRLPVEGGSMDQVKTFYSCLYRVLFFPTKTF